MAAQGLHTSFRAQSGFERLLERIVRRLDAFGAKIDLALRAVMGSVNEHVKNHGAAVRVGAALPGRDVPSALELLRRDLG